MDNRQKYDKALHQEINRVLQKEWDPIGVADVPEAQDEYESYVPQIYAMLIRRQPISEIFDYLWWIETEHMELRGDRAHTLRIAAKLASLGSKSE